MKHINKFNSISEALNATGVYSPNVSYVNGASNPDGLVYTNVGVDKEIVFENNSNVISGKLAPAKVGDYLYIDMTYSTIYDSSKTPIGICVAPASHFQDGKARWMSLVNMSATDPENGTTATGNDSDSNPGAGFCWGAKGNITGITNYSTYNPYALKTNPNAITSSNPAGLVNMLDNSTSGYLIRDYDNGVSDNVYPFANGYYGVGSTNSYYNKVTPCPFNQDGSLNTLYSTNRVLSDRNGKANTQLIIAKASKYSTGTIAKDDSSSGSYPAAMACYRFNAGIQSLTNEWYLPAEGELAYALTSITKINANLAILGNSAVLIGVRSGWTGSTDTYDNLGSMLLSSSFEWSDSEWYASSYGTVGFMDKSLTKSDSRVRAFLAY